MRSRADAVPFFSQRVVLALCVLVFGAVVLTISLVVPIAADTVTVVRHDRSPETLVLEEGATFSQTFRSPHGVVSGLVFFSEDERFSGRSVKVRILDASGSERFRSALIRPSYAEGLLRMEVPWFWLPVNAGETLTAELTITRGPPLRVRIASEDVYAGGFLAVNAAPIEGKDGALSVVVPAALSSAAQQGVLAGVVLLFGLLLVYFLPRERQRWWGAGILLAAGTPLALGGFWFSLGSWGISDWDFYFSLYEIARRSVLEYHTLPFWNSYICGGTAGLADPVFPVLSPMMLPVLLFGVPAGLRVAIYASVIIGSVGMLLLAKRLRLSLDASVLASVGAWFGSVLLLRLVEGHVDIVFSVVWTAWVLWSWLGAYHRRRSSFLCGVFLALMFLQGGVYILMYTFVALVILSLLARRRVSAFVTTISSVAWASGFIALKLVPGIFWLREFQDQAFASSAFTIPFLPEVLLGRHLYGAQIIPGQNGGWHEYGAYVGPILLLLALVGATRARTHRVARLLLCSSALALLFSSSGPLLKPALDLLPFLPRSNVSRVVLFAVLPLALLAGVGLDTLKAAGRRWSVVPLLLIGIVVVDLMSMAYPLSEQAFVIPEVFPPPEAAPAPLAFTADAYRAEWRGEGHTRSYAAILAGYGTLSYCSAGSPSIVYNDEPKVRTIQDGTTSFATVYNGKGVAEVLDWSPNHARVRVSAETPAAVLLNTNYVAGWKVNGEPAAEMQGRVGSPVVPEEQVLLFRYRAPGFALGLALTLGTLVCAAFRLRKTGAGKRIMQA